jgi:type IV pilus assembly protein PilB
MKKAKKKLGEILLEAKVVRADQLNMALEQQKRWGGRLASILVEMGSVDEKTIAAVLEEQMGYKCIALHDVQVPPEVLKMTDIETIDEISFSLGVDVDPVCASESGIADAIHKFYGKKPSR